MTVDWEQLWETPERPENNNVVDLPIHTDGKDSNYALKALRGEAADVASAVKGHRNDALNRAWFNMNRHILAGTIAETTVVTALTNAGRSIGLDDKEIATCLRGDTRTQVAQKVGPRIPPPMPDLPAVTIIDEPKPADLDQFWQARDILQHLHTYARARLVAPWAVLGNTLTRVIASVPPSIALPPIVGGPASLNLFVAVVGRSGSGKGAAEAVSREALDVGPLTIRNTGSGEGALHAYVKRLRDGSLDQHTKSVLFSISEIDSLGAVGARQGATIMSLLRQGWSGEQLGYTYADAQKNLIVEAHGYRMCLVAGVQPGRAGTLLDDADGGTPQRFAWFLGIDPGAPDHVPDAPEPRQLFQRDPIEIRHVNGLLYVDVCQQARDTIVSERRKNLRGDGEALDGHVLLTRLKVAAALGFMDRRRSIDDEDWELSGVIMQMSDATRSRVIAHRNAEVAKAADARAHAEASRQVIVSETLTEKAVARVAKALHRRIQGNEVAWHEGRKLLASRDREYFEEALDHLVRAGLIKVTETSSGSVLTSTEEKS